MWWCMAEVVAVVIVTGCGLVKQMEVKDFGGMFIALDVCNTLAHIPKENIRRYEKRHFN